MMTVAEEVVRAVQKAIAPQEVANSASKAREVINSGASQTAAPSSSPPSPTSSPCTVTVQRSPAFSLSSQSYFSNSGMNGDKACFDDATLANFGGCFLIFYCAR